MPVTRVQQSELPRATRRSKIAKTVEWNEVNAAIKQGIKMGEVLRITFSPETKKAFKGDEKKAASSFALRLRNELGDGFRVQVVGGTEVRVSNKQGK
jgi:hypothetical protein